MNRRNAVDAALEFGAGFDWITPLASALTCMFTDMRPHKCHECFQPEVEDIAKRLGIKLHNRMLVGDQYCFDCTPQDWERIQRIRQAVRVEVERER